MARVVQRRGGPPYLLILFVILTVLAAALAVVFYMQGDKEEQRNVEQAKEIRELKSDVQTLRKDKAQLAEMILGVTGQNASVEQINKDFEQLMQLEALEGENYISLAAPLRDLNEQIASREARIKELEGQVSSLRSDLQARSDAFDKARAKIKGELEAVQARLEATEARQSKALAEREKEHQKTVEQLRDDLNEKNKRISVLSEEKKDLDLKIQEKDATIEELRRRIAKMKPETSPGELLLREADGKVVLARPEEKLCYINLGREDNIKPGLTFSVYSPQTGVPESGEPIAKLQVVAVGEKTSQCRITQVNKGEAVTQGALVANMIYGGTRGYAFFVDGAFDLYGDGRPDPMAARQVRKLIEDFGGKVVDSIDIGTDFAVLGSPPPLPPKPEEGDVDAWPVYNRKLQEYNEYRESVRAATAMNVPILDTERFLALSGYVPRKRLDQ
jgi:outer membrane murein-binding lipoprotein Lpp